MRFLTVSIGRFVVVSFWLFRRLWGHGPPACGDTDRIPTVVNTLVAWGTPELSMVSAVR
jgi:hypothetical protein